MSLDNLDNTTYNRPLLYWSILRRPQSYQDMIRTVPPSDKALVLSILPQGRVAEAYAGWANCRICGIELGTKDLAGLGFVWPEKAEHYIEAHGVWTADLDDFVWAVKSAGLCR